MVTTEGFDREVWSQLASGIGLQGILIPSRYGGAGGSYGDVVVGLEEIGRVLLGGPYLAQVLASAALLQVGDDTVNATVLPRIATGELLATLAVAEEFAGCADETYIPVTAVATGDDRQYLLSGSRNFVIDGHVADLIITAARSGAGMSLFAVESTAAGFSRHLVPTIDQTRRMASLKLSDTPARLVGEAGGAARWLPHIMDLAVLALSAEQLGGSERCLEMAVDYAKTRSAFGRPIGSFQAIKHLCAELFVSVRAVAIAIEYAAEAASEDPQQLHVLAPLIKAECSETYSRVASANIHVHGAMGFAWEHDAHLFLKRAKVGEQYLGSPASHRAELALRAGFA